MPHNRSIRFNRILDGSNLFVYNFSFRIMYHDNTPFAGVAAILDRGSCEDRLHMKCWCRVQTLNDARARVEQKCLVCLLFYLNIRGDHVQLICVGHDIVVVL